MFRRMDAKERGERIKQERLKKGLSQEKLGRAIGVSQPAIKKIEAGTTENSKLLPKIAKELGVPLHEIAPGLDGPTPGAEGPYTVRQRDFPIHAATVAPGGEITVSENPVEKTVTPTVVESVAGAYGVIVAGTSMEPELKQGMIAILHPHMPLTAGGTFLLFQEEDGAGPAMFREIVKVAKDKVTVRQHSPARETVISTKDWPWAHQVVAIILRR